MMYRECLTTLAPILISFSHGVLSDHFLTGFGNKYQKPQKITKVVSQRKELKANLIIHNHTLFHAKCATDKA